MADDPNVQKDDLDVFQDSSEIKGSMSHRMEHPEEYLDASSEETPEEKAAREAAEAAAATETPEEKSAREAREAETPEQKAAREQAEREAAAAQSEDDKTKDWTIEDYKKNRKEAETRMHEATGETAKEKAAREAAEARAAELEAKLAEKEAAAAKPPETSVEERKAELRKAIVTARQKAFIAIGELEGPGTNPDYQKQMAEIWGQADVEIEEAREKFNPQSVGDLDAHIQATLKAERDKDEAKRAETRKADEEAENARIWQNAQDLATKGGLDLKNRTVMVSFREYCREIPEEFQTKPLEDQVDWVMGKVRADLGIHVQQTDEERRLALENQNRNQVLGKGGGLPPKEEFKPKSFSESLESVSP